MVLNWILSSLYVQKHSHSQQNKANMFVLQGEFTELILSLELIYNCNIDLTASSWDLVRKFLIKSVENYIFLDVLLFFSFLEGIYLCKFNV